MQVHSSVSRISRILFAFLLVAGSVALVGSNKPSSPGQNPWRDKALVDFVNPGLKITINSAAISSAGVITVTYTLTDPTGLPLDASGATTPGAISLAYVAAYIPKGQEQYVAYTTASATGAVLGTIIRPDFEVFTAPAAQVGPGQYTYTFTAKAPAGFDPTVTTTVAVDGNRDLTAFNLGTNYAGATFNFVPNGSAVTVTRDVIRTESCNTCHDQLAFHGGYASGMPMCVMCHQPQNADPATGNTLDLKVFAHKLHMGSQLPSVLGYTSGTTKVPPAPYEIIGYMNSVNNFSTVIDPAMPQRCEVCHSQTTGAAQAKAFLTEPTRAACGACHDDVNFATGVNHPGGFQEDDTQCANCHIPQGEMPFDASIMGAHVVATDTAATYPQNPDTLLAGINLAITGVTNTTAGQTPTVTFTVQDNKGNNIALSQLSTLQFTMAGPTTDYGYTSFGSGTASTPGYVTESAAKATCSSSGACSYTFTHAIPAGATGTYTIGGEARTTVTVSGRHHLLAERHGSRHESRGELLGGRLGGNAAAHRGRAEPTAITATSRFRCMAACATTPSIACCATIRRTRMPATRVSATVAADKALPPQGINFNLLVHRIHDGVNAATNPGGPPKNPYIVVGFGGSHQRLLRYPLPGHEPGRRRHLHAKLLRVPRQRQRAESAHRSESGARSAGLDPANPVQPVSSACSGCHVSEGESSHFLANTDVLGESCNVCHAAGAQFAVDAVHVQ